MLKVLVAVAIFGAVLTATPASASHDTIYSPCSTEYGFIHMTYDEWAAHITTMEADGTIPPGVVFRYYEALHGGKGTNVQEETARFCPLMIGPTATIQRSKPSCSVQV